MFITSVFLLCLTFNELPVLTVALDWEGSSIWPAVNGIEKFHSVPDSILRTWSFSQQSKDLFEHTVEGEAADIIAEAIQRFFEMLDRSIPAEHNDTALYPVNPHDSLLIPITHVDVQIESDNTTIADAEESYQLNVDAPDAPLLRVHTETVYGALHALQTILQLIEFGWIDPASSTPVFTMPKVPKQLIDSPEYSYRGILIDTSRHFLPLTTIIQPHLDLMAAHKLNVLHWHLTDDQSWPWKSETFPELVEPHCKDCVYTSSSIIHDVVLYAKYRGIRVIVEVDTPGHTKAIGSSHPELLTRCRDAPLGPLDATQPAVYDFVDGVYEELMEVFPDPFIHLGGDEIDLSCWQESKAVQDWIQRHNITDGVIGLLEYFEAHLIDLVINHGRVPVVWQDVFDYGAVLPKSVIFDVWQGWIREGSMQNITSAEYNVIISACWYLDHLGDDWWKLYTCNPRDRLSTVEQKRRVLGGHASMWAEYVSLSFQKFISILTPSFIRRVDATNFMERVWPRSSTVAEVLWCVANTTKQQRPDGAFRSSFTGRGAPLLTTLRRWIERLLGVD